jgi:hypothetical protein
MLIETIEKTITCRNSHRNCESVPSKTNGQPHPSPNPKPAPTTSATCCGNPNAAAPTSQPQPPHHTPTGVHRPITQTPQLHPAQPQPTNHVTPAAASNCTARHTSSKPTSKTPNNRRSRSIRSGGIWGSSAYSSRWPVWGLWDVLRRGWRGGGGRAAGGSP